MKNEIKCHSCGCSQSDKMKVRKDIIGEKYGRLTVIERANDIVYGNGDRYPAYRCKCDCGNECVKAATYIKGFKDVCCTECSNKKISNSLYDENEFCPKDDYYEVKCNNSDLVFLIDAEDKDKVAQHCWYIHKSDRTDNLFYVYGRHRTSREHLKLHRYILDCYDDELVIDHENHNGLDNRKANLNICFVNENAWNKSEVRGNIPYQNITFDKNRNQYVVVFRRYGKVVFNRYVSNLEEAIKISKKVRMLVDEAYKTNQTICIDVDNIICNTTQCVLNKINSLLDTKYSISDVTEYSIESILPDENKHIVNQIFEDKTMWKNLALIPHSVDAIRNLHKRGYKILFATATTSTNFNPKIRFLKRNFPFINCETDTICVKNKQILKCDYLIDDSPEQLLNGEYKGIALKYPWNENIDGYEKCDTWWDILKIIISDHQQIHNAEYIKNYIKNSLPKENENDDVSP